MMASTERFFPNREREQSQARPGELASPFTFMCTVIVVKCRRNSGAGMLHNDDDGNSSIG